MTKKIVAIMGSYRKGGVIDSLVDQVLAAAKERGAQVSKISLVDKRIEFCRNCRSCTQEQGEERGQCVFEDEMDDILKEIDSAQGIVLGAPVNFGNVNALTRRFIERLVCYAHWPWEKSVAPVIRKKSKRKKAVLLTSSAMPAIMGRVMTGALHALRKAANMIGAKPVATLHIGLAATKQNEVLPERVLRKARKAGYKLAAKI